jgi:hypothetical protein
MKRTDWLVLFAEQKKSAHGPDVGACRSDVVAGGEDRPFPVALPRSRGRVPAAIREPQNRQVWVRARVCQRVGPRGLREAAHQMR